MINELSINKGMRSQSLDVEKKTETTRR